MKGLVDPSAGAGFVLGAFGLSASFLSHFFVYGFLETYGSHSVMEDTADSRLSFLISVHRWAGPVAVFLGLALVVWGSRGGGRRVDRRHLLG